jgi:hypothetical protein
MIMCSLPQRLRHTHRPDCPRPHANVSRVRRCGSVSSGSTRPSDGSPIAQRQSTCIVASRGTNYSTIKKSRRQTADRLLRTPTVYAVSAQIFDSNVPYPVACSLSFCSTEKKIVTLSTRGRCSFRLFRKVFLIRLPSASRAPDARSGRGAKRGFFSSFLFFAPFGCSSLYL